MLISNNIANKTYVHTLSNINNLQKSAERLASGDKYANASEGAGEIGVSDLLRLEISGNQTILNTLQNAGGFAATQDAILGQVAEIADRMYEIAAAAVDPMKSTAERVALNNEFTALSTEVASIAGTSKYNGINLFDNSVSIRIGTDSTDVFSFASVALSLLTFGSMSVGTVTAASAALSTIALRVGSLADLRATARTNNGRVQRTLLYTQDYIANIENAESAIRDVDVAKEASEFARQQVILSAGQSVLSQANGLTQGLLRFLQ